MSRKLSRALYAWERQGRGWALWNYPVELEPVFEPFTISRLSSALHTQPSHEKAPTARYPTSDLIELRLDGDSQTLSNAVEQIVVANLSYPICFELVSQEGHIHPQLVYSKSEAAMQSPSLSFLYGSYSTSKVTLQTSWERIQGHSAVLQFGLSEEFMVPLRVADNVHDNLLQPVMEVLEQIGSREMGLFQVLFQPLRHPWSESVQRVLRLDQDSPYVVTSPRLLSEAREKIRYALCAVIVRVAAKATSGDRANQIIEHLKRALQVYSGHGTNALMPMERIDYPGGIEVEDVLTRTTHRSGMILNRRELLGLLCMPTVVGEEAYSVLQEQTGDVNSENKSSRRPRKRKAREKADREDRPVEVSPHDLARGDVPPTVEPPAKEGISAPPPENRRQHTYLKELITRLASSAGWLPDETVSIATSPGSVYINFRQDEQQVGCLVSITSTLAEELTHVKACLAHGLPDIVVIAVEPKRIKELERGFETYLDPEDLSRVHVLTVEGLLTFLERPASPITTRTQSTVHTDKGTGYTVEVRYPTNHETDTRREAVSEILAGALKRMKKI